MSETSGSGGSWGADSPQGPGWYQAADLKWYPPATAAAPTEPAAPAPGPPPTTTTAAYPAELDFTGPLEVSRWLPLYAWLAAIPHFFVLLVYGLVAFVYAIIAFFSVLFTGEVPESAHTFIVKVARYAQRVEMYVLFMNGDYPEFGLSGGDIDDGSNPVRVSIAHAPELKRWAPLYKWLLAIPHFIILEVLGIAMGVCVLIGFFAVLFTGKWPEGLRTFIIGIMRWQLRVNAYLLLRDEYPPFALE
jgi:hypothetical protein